MSATPGLTVHPKGVLLETLRRRIIALQEEGYNDDFLRAIREAHRELERKEKRLAALELAAWDACEVAWRNLENPEDWNSSEVKAAWDALGELLPAKRPADSASSSHADQG